MVYCDLLRVVRDVTKNLCGPVRSFAVLGGPLRSFWRSFAVLCGPVWCLIVPLPPSITARVW